MLVYFQLLQERAQVSSEVPAAELSSLWICQLLGGFVRSRLSREPWQPSRLPAFRAFLGRLTSEAESVPS